MTTRPARLVRNDSSSNSFGVSLRGAPARVVTHKQILTAVWGPAHTEDTQYLRVYVGQLRQKIEEHADDPRIILTEPGIGYRIAEN